jgi:hypothetical protein
MLECDSNQWLPPTRRAVFYGNPARRFSDHREIQLSCLPEILLAAFCAAQQPLH